jgi:hypothetical protein
LDKKIPGALVARRKNETHNFSIIFSGILTVMLIFSSCTPTPSDEIIQTAITKTELASTST